MNVSSSEFRVPGWGMRLTAFLLFTVHCSLFTGTAHAHLPMETEYAETLPKDSWETRFHAGFMDMSAGDNNRMTEQMYELEVGYGLTRDLSLYVQPTYKVKEMKMPMGSMMVMKESSSGIGDTDLLARYRFLKKDREDGTCQQALLLGVKLPTGAWNIKDNGSRLMDMAQPGTGSTDYRGGFATTWRRGNLTLDGDAIYTLKTENQSNYKFGNLLSYDVAALYQGWGIYRQSGIYFMLELNGRLAEKDEAKGIKDDNTGGHQIFINPGVSYHIMPNLMLMLSVQLPVYANMNGDAQKTNYHAMGGLHWYY